MEAFFRTANYPLVESSDMSAEVREEALDVCLLACEKHSADMEKCTQVRFHCCSATGAWLRMQQLRLGAVLALCDLRCARLGGAPLSCHVLACRKAFETHSCRRVCSYGGPGRMQVIKEQLDKKLGAPWHVVAGQHYAYEVTHECRNMLHVFIGGKLGVLCWKT
jgi:hypothetical protein